MSSVKNFQLIEATADNTNGVVLLQLGKMSEDKFSCDYRWPLTAVQALGIALTAF